MLNTATLRKVYEPHPEVHELCRTYKPSKGFPETAEMRSLTKVARYIADVLNEGNAAARVQSTAPFWGFFLPPRANIYVWDLFEDAESQRMESGATIEFELVLGRRAIIEWSNRSKGGVCVLTIEAGPKRASTSVILPTLHREVVRGWVAPKGAW